MFESKEILLVEDDPQSLELTLHALRHARLADNVRIMSDGEEALDYILRRGKYRDRDPHDPPVLVLLDLRLPGISGLELLRQIRENEHTRLIPVVVFSASRSDLDILQSYGLGANGYVVKPVDFEEFTRVIHELGLYWLALNVPPSA